MRSVSWSWILIVVAGLAGTAFLARSGMGLSEILLIVSIVAVVWGAHALDDLAKRM